MAKTKRNKNNKNKMMKKKGKKNATRKLKYMASMGGVKKGVSGFSDAATNAINARASSEPQIPEPQITEEPQSPKKYPDIPSDILAPHPQPLTNEQIEQNTNMTDDVRTPPPISPRSYLLNKQTESNMPPESDAAKELTAKELTAKELAAKELVQPSVPLVSEEEAPLVSEAQLDQTVLEPEPDALAEVPALESGEQQEQQQQQQQEQQQPEPDALAEASALESGEQQEQQQEQQQQEQQQQEQQQEQRQEQQQQEQQQQEQQEQQEPVIPDAATTTVSQDEEQIKNEAIKELEKIGEETAQLLKELKEKITPENQEQVVAASTDAVINAVAAAAGGSKAEIKRRKKTFYRKFNSKKSMKRKNKTNRNK